MSQPVTYSFKDTSGGFAHPLAGVFSFFGQIGLHQLSITMSTDKSVLETAADGTVMISAMSGDAGQLSIEMQQTSRLNAFLLAWYNTIKTLMDSGDVTNWATAVITVRNIVDGSSHVLRGVCPAKIADKSYQAQGQRITWLLLAADVQNITLGQLV